MPSGPWAVWCSSVPGLMSNEVQLAYLLFQLGKGSSEVYADTAARMCHLARFPGVGVSAHGSLECTPQASASPMMYLCPVGHKGTPRSPACRVQAMGKCSASPTSGLL